MILRRLSQSLKQQNWTAIWIEFILLVTGVFLGIQVANWNEQRTERQSEIEYLYKMENDILASMESMQSVISRLEKQQAARKKLYEYSIHSDQVLPRNDIDRLLRGGLYESVSMKVRQTTFDSLKSSGRLDLLKSDELILSLLQLNESIDEGLRRQSDEYQIMYLFSDPLLVQNFEMGRILKNPKLGGQGKSISWLTEVKPEEPIPDVIKTVMFSNVVLYRAAITENRLRGLYEILDQYKKTKKLVVARKARLEGDK